MYYSRAAVLIIAVFFMACNLPAGKPALAKQQEVPEQSTGMISVQLEMPVGVNLCVYPQNPTTASPLKPSKIGEFASPDDDSDDETYPYRLDPNGKYYHFETFVSDGNTQWDAFEVFEETFTATSTLAPAGANRYDAENLRNDKNRAKGGGIRATTWCEGAAGYGIGERVNMSVKTKGNVGSDEKRRFRSLLIVNGYAKDATVWKNNSRVKILRLHVGGKHWCDLYLQDIIKPQIFHLPDNLLIYPAKHGRVLTEKVYQTDLSFEIIETYPGDKFDDTCITGIALDVYGDVY